MKTCSLALLGSTGSIGKSALAVARALRDRIKVSLLAAGFLLMLLYSLFGRRGEDQS